MIGWQIDYEKNIHRTIFFKQNDMGQFKLMCATQNQDF